MKKRIYGLETEYGIALIWADGSWSCDRNHLSRYLDLMKDYLGGEFLANGSRVYIDLNYHPEYCTAECTNLIDLIAQDKAGEKILNRIFAEIVRDRATDVAKIILFKNNCQYYFRDERQEANLVTFGCHENFLMSKNLTIESLAAVLTPFLVVRQIIAGSGWVADPFHQSQKSLRYAISQRSRFILAEISRETHTNAGSRGIFCSARWEEPHANKEKYRRLHLLLGDSNLSELSTYLKMGLVVILLEMLEENYSFDDLISRFTLKDPVNALHAVSWDLSCKTPVIELIDGRHISAIDLFWAYIELINKYKAAQGLSQESSDVLANTIDILQRLERRKIDSETLMEIDSQGLEQELDWLIKKTILEYVLGEYGCHWNNFYKQDFSSEVTEPSLYEHIRAKDLKYHDTSNKGIYNDYTAKPDLPLSDLRTFDIRTPRMVEKERIVNMEKNPPQDNRAKIRGEFIKFFNAKGYSSCYEANWSYLKIRGDLIGQSSYVQYLIDLSDPFMTKSKEMEYIIGAE